MKTNIAIILALTFILTSCSTTKKASSTTEKVTTQNELDSGSTDAMNKTEVQSTSESFKSEYADLFSELEMNKDQISTFTAAMNRFKEQQANTASGEILGSIDSERTRQLENILSSSQYAKYEQWMAKNK
ncbi:hypothetical protein PXC01_04470 [Maribacter sp. M208]|uniref:hypothetical protein n=1 Tax=Maribacter TaxID=252356 RepID=UPI0023EC6904|nr:MULTISPECIES: hypothetical protein [Maribacter]MDF4220831.1 hypothetical protein [Maribacter huludaoensis]